VLTVLTTAAMQARQRQSLLALEGGTRSPSMSPTVERRPVFDEHGGHKEEDESPASPGADHRRRRFTTAASIALRKSIDGPHFQEEEEVSAKRLRSLLAKTSAANVGAVVDR